MSATTYLLGAGSVGSANQWWGWTIAVSAVIPEGIPAADPLDVDIPASFGRICPME